MVLDHLLKTGTGDGMMREDHIEPQTILGTRYTMAVATRLLTWIDRLECNVCKLRFTRVSYNLCRPMRIA
jgi:hypothetical protein